MLRNHSINSASVCPRKVSKAAPGVQQRFLHQIRLVQLGLQGLADSQAGQQLQVVAVGMQQLPPRRFTALPGLKE